MSNPGWKKFERRIALDLGGRRIGILGGEDVEHPFLSGECKLLKKLPKFLTDVYDQAKKNCPKGKIPFACVKQNGKHDKNSLIILSYEDFNKMVLSHDLFRTALETEGRGK